MSNTSPLPNAEQWKPRSSSPTAEAPPLAKSSQSAAAENHPPSDSDRPCLAESKPSLLVKPSQAQARPAQNQPHRAARPAAGGDDRSLLQPQNPRVHPRSRQGNHLHRAPRQGKGKKG
ncbi:hypothetical protein AAC387_Pa04g2523 [Persea americana]